MYDNYDDITVPDGRPAQRKENLLIICAVISTVSGVVACFFGFIAVAIMFWAGGAIAWIIKMLGW